LAYLIASFGTFVDLFQANFFLATHWQGAGFDYFDAESFGDRLGGYVIAWFFAPTHAFEGEYGCGC